MRKQVLLWRTGRLVDVAREAVAVREGGRAGRDIRGAVTKGRWLQMLAVARCSEVEGWWCLVSGRREKGRKVGRLGSVGSVVGGHDK